MVRSRKLTLTDWTAANNALELRFGGNKSELAKHAKMSRTTITNFFNEEPIGQNSFKKICRELRLPWQQVSSNDIASNSSKDESDQPADLIQLDETLIEQVRKRCRQKILERHSRMRLLSGEEIGVDQLYVDVWLLEKPEYKHFNSPESLLKNFDIAKDRLALSKRIQRNPGFEIADSHSKLIILGKPGSGKTTFLKHLAIDWCNGKFQPDSIPILLELRQIQEPVQDNEWNILSVIGQELGLDGWQQFASTKQKLRNLKIQVKKLRKEINDLKNNLNTNEQVTSQRNLSENEKEYLNSLKTKKEAEETIKRLKDKSQEFPLHSLLATGNLFILMDGFDELPTNNLRNNIREQLLEISQDYPENRFILTCRTQIIGVIPNGFTSVEVADFSPEQVKAFFLNWFAISGRTIAEANKQWKTFNEATSNQPDLKELTATPVLLSLMCLVLKDEKGIMPKDRSWLYKKGIQLLLSRWNDKKEIEDWEVGTEAYRQLSIDDKEALLIEIAAQKFNNPKNFVLFEQDELVRQITQSLQLKNTREGISILKAIEAHHGFLIERADQLWSFSHLTFQEYFTVQWLTRLSPQKLAKKIVNRQWQKVVEQLVQSQQPADRLLRLIKQAIDKLIAQQSNIQMFLTWTFQKSKSFQKTYKSKDVRVSYHSYELTLNLILDLASNFNRISRLPNVILTYTRVIDLDMDHALDFARIVNRSYELISALTTDIDNTNNDLIIGLIDLDLAIDFILNSAIENAINFTCVLDRNLTNRLHKLKNELPVESNAMNSQYWWQSYGEHWVHQLRQIIFRHRNISDDWQFTWEQQKQLQNYYEANIFLVNLMSIKGAVSEECRAEIEDGLLLPWAELQRRQPHLYGEL